MKKNESGFSLVELMVVVGIIGILASLALPKLQVFMAKSKQAEAKVILPSVFSLQQSYFADNNTYGDTSAKIGLVVVPKYFTTGMTYTASATAFTATLAAPANAFCTGSLAESWSIDQDKNLKQGTSTTFSPPACT
jgi:prepilin-type N-terminal cleavage/methylation domain-containing protein